MSLVQANTFNLMEQNIIPPLSTDLMLEEKAINDLLETARILANRYHNPYRWPLDKEEIFGELGLEIAKSVNKYLYCKVYSEYLSLGRKMLWNRTRELLSQAYGTKRKIERTAQSLPEEDEDTAETYDMVSDFLESEHYKSLSDLAKQVVNLILEPTDKLHEALLEHINYRNKLYKSGGGLNGIPAKVIAKALELNLSTIKKIYEEISEAINKEVVYMSTLNTTSKQLDFANTLVTWQDYLINELPVKYIRWSLVDLENQAKFREVYEEGMKRSQVIQALQANDAANGRASDSDIPLFAKQAEESKEELENLPENTVALVHGEVITSDEDEFEKLPASGVKNDPPLQEIKKVAIEEDDEFGPRIKKNVEVEEEPVTMENEETDFEEFSTDLAVEEGFVGTTEEVVETEEPAEDLTLTEVVTPTHPAADSNVMVFARLLEAMKQGDTLHVTKLSSNEWSIDVVQNLSSTSVIAPKIFAPGSEVVVKAKEPKKKKSGTYIEAVSKLRAMSDEILVGYAKSTDLVWTEVEDPKINRMRITMAYMKQNNINKYEE